MTSKYSSLPDIDAGADLFETPDEPHSSALAQDLQPDSDETDSDDGGASPSRDAARKLGGAGNENIDSSRLETSEARRRFADAALDASNR